MHWLDLSWWRWLITGQVRYGQSYYPRRPILVRSLGHLVCRVKGHPCGPIRDNPGGLEPNWQCRECGDDLG